MSGLSSESNGRVPAQAGALLSIGTLSELTGITTDTIRAWERRYGRPVPVRLPSGHRRYTEAHVRLLLRVSEAIARGHRPAALLRASDEQLEAMLTAADDLPAPSSAIHSLLDAVRRLDRATVMARLEAEWKRLPPDDFLDECIVPLVTAVGLEWVEGRLQVRHEHFFSEVLEDVLRSLRVSLPDAPSRGLLLLATMSGERHGLGLQMTALLCAIHGIRTHVLGTDTPVEEIAAAARETNAAAVAVSVSLATGGIHADRDLARLRGLLSADVHLIVGGAGARGPRRVPRGVVHLADHEALRRWLDGHLG
ncbi:MAG: MerR family transcriptional regulator [Planctomycetota bacterium]|jgi:methanogenic corrinoid protein MtbC1